MSDRPFLYWRDELRENPDNGLVQIDCTKKVKQKFVDAICSVFSSLDNYFVKNDLYKYNDYYQFLDEDFMDQFDLELLYPKFIQDKSLKEEGSAGVCEFNGEDYSDIKIDSENLFDKPTICHEFIHYLTLNYFYRNHPKDERFKKFINPISNKSMLLFEDKMLEKKLSKSEGYVQNEMFFTEGLTQFLTEEVFPSDKGKVYTSLVEMIRQVSNLVGKQKVIGDFLSGNIDSIAEYFGNEEWEGKYVGNYGEFVKNCIAYQNEYQNQRNHIFSCSKSQAYINAQKCLLRAYLKHVKNDGQVHSAEELNRLVKFCEESGDISQTFPYFVAIIKSGKFENIDSIKKELILANKYAIQDKEPYKYEIDDIALSHFNKNGTEYYAVEIGGKQFASFEFDNVYGFMKMGIDENGKEKLVENKHTQEYYEIKCRNVKFKDGTSPADVRVELSENAIRLDFYDYYGKNIHSFMFNNEMRKYMNYDENVLDLSDGEETIEF